MSWFSAALSRGALFAVALAGLAACTVVVDESGPGSRPVPDGGGLCTREYAPVCARRGGDRQTFANACRAERAGYRVIRDGECRRGGGGGGDGPSVCTAEYVPVCARRGGERRTFSNACVAEGAGYRIIGNGECRRGDEGAGGGSEQRACTREYAPVCGRRGSDRRSFPNACEARAADYRVIGDGPC